MGGGSKGSVFVCARLRLPNTPFPIQVLLFLRKTVPRIPLSRLILPSFAIPPEQMATGLNGGRASGSGRAADANGGQQDQQQQAAAAAAANAAAVAALPPISDAVSVTRTFCGALFLPSVAAFLGSALYSGVPGRLRRTLLGGATFIVVKGVLKIYHKQHTYIRQCQRVILDYNELPSAAPSSNHRAHSN